MIKLTPFQLNYANLKVNNIADARGRWAIQDLVDRGILARVFQLVAAVIAITISPESNALAQQPVAAIDKQEISFSANKEKKTIEVLVDSKLFTTFNYGDGAKPFLHPVFGPENLRMTRDFPISKTAGEANDHPHHKSIWIGHEINELDFWTNKGGVIKVDKIPKIDARAGSFSAHSRWISQDGTTVCRDETTWTFGATPGSRWIDCEFKLLASEGSIEITDTKEGTVAIRTHPSLRLKPDAKRGVEKVTGKAFNSTGIKGSSIWGQPAAWVAYTGNIDSKPASIVLLDHPKNFRHPTTWHARDYGLVAANPFGLAAFLGTRKAAGAVTLAKGQSITLKYRFQFFSRVVSANDCDKAFEDFSSPNMQE